MARVKWKYISLEDRTELLRTEALLNGALNNLALSLFLVLASVLAPFTLFTIWLPLLFLVVAVSQSIRSWSENDENIDRIRGGSLLDQKTTPTEKK